MNEAAAAERKGRMSGASRCESYGGDGACCAASRRGDACDCACDAPEIGCLRDALDAARNACACDPGLGVWAIDPDVSTADGGVTFFQVRPVHTSGGAPPPDTERMRRMLVEFVRPLARRGVVQAEVFRQLIHGRLLFFRVGVRPCC